MHELQQQLQAATLQGGAVQQQRQQQALSTGTGLPELRQSESPQPPGQLGNGTQQDSPGSSAALSALPAAGLGVLAAAGSGLGISSTSLGGQTLHRSRYQQSQHSQQLLPDAASGLTASRSSVGGVSAAASKVLQAAAPSFYNGAGPLTSGMRPAWSSSNQGRGVQAGADLAQVLRSGLNPGNKSLAELQAEYKAARTLVLDRLRQQKEAAEVQRKHILLQLGRAISHSAWRA